MSQAGAETVLPQAGRIDELQESFRVFNRVTRDLEQVYRRLQHRAEAVEGRLRETNARLTHQVEELGRLNDELSGTLTAIPCGVVVCDEAGVVARVNPAAESILGRPAAELVGRSAATLRGPEGEPVLLLGRDSFEVGPTLERRVACLDGATRHLGGSVAALPEGGHLEVLSDQTEVAHLRAQINRLDTLAALGEMAAGVAHEIRNPMNGVQGFAGLLEKALNAPADPCRADLRRYVDRIRQGIGEVNGIISHLLLWARPEKAEARPVRLDALLREISGEAGADAGGPRGGRLRLEVPEEPLVVRGDRLKLKMALGNLVRNALEAVPAGGRVRVVAAGEEGSAVVKVEDDGPGLDPSVRGRLFQPFATTKGSGTGLGLAIARKLVDLHGGEIEAGSSSSLGGACFTVTLPRRGGEEGA